MLKIAEKTIQFTESRNFTRNIQTVPHSTKYMKNEEEELLTCPVNKNKKFFPTSEEIDFPLKPEIILNPGEIEKPIENYSMIAARNIKIPLRTQRKSLTGVGLIVPLKNSTSLKKLTRTGGKRNIFSVDERNNKNLRRMPLHIEELNENISFNGVNEQTPSSLNISSNKNSVYDMRPITNEINLNKERFQIKMSSGFKKINEINNSEKALLSPQDSPFVKNMRGSIKKGESRNKSPNSSMEDLNNKKKNFPYGSEHIKQVYIFYKDILF